MWPLIGQVSTCHWSILTSSHWPNSVKLSFTMSNSFSRSLPFLIWHFCINSSLPSSCHHSHSLLHGEHSLQDFITTHVLIHSTHSSLRTCSHATLITSCWPYRSLCCNLHKNISRNHQWVNYITYNLLAIKWISQLPTRHLLCLCSCICSSQLPNPSTNTYNRSTPTQLQIQQYPYTWICCGQLLEDLQLMGSQ